MARQKSLDRKSKAQDSERPAIGDNHQTQPGQVLSQTKEGSSGFDSSPEGQGESEQPASVEEAVEGGLETVSGSKEPWEVHSREIPKEFLSFLISGEEYAVDIMKIREIIRPMEITCIPRTPPYIKGIISLRGTVVPIFDLHQRLGLEQSKQGAKSRVVVTASETGPAGFMVDLVTEVIKVNPNSIEPPPSTVKGKQAEYLKGVSRYKNRMIIVLDVEKVLNTDPLSVASPKGEKTDRMKQ